MAWSSIDKAPTYGVVNPNNGSFFYNINENKWYNPDGSENTNGVNFLNSIVYGDSTGNPLYIEELQKIKYENIVEANEFKSRNSCTAWVNFDGTTTPPTIRDSYNVSQVIRTSTGVYDVYFEEVMDNDNYTVSSTQAATSSNSGNTLVINSEKTNNKFIIRMFNNSGTYFNADSFNIQVFGGK